MINIDEKPTDAKDLAAKIAKANVIVAKILVSIIFLDWENRTRSDIIEMIEKCNREMDLGIKPINTINTMIKKNLIHQNGTYNDEPFYSTKKAKEIMYL